jgi:4'-phosphopantetheinyl transferase
MEPNWDLIEGSSVETRRTQNRREEDCRRSLKEGEAHLWFVSLALVSDKISDFKSLLSADEQERADRFRAVQDADRYVAARGWLRTLLGSYLSIEPHRLQFSYDSFGKPHLSDNAPSMSFSVSHCDDWGLFGFTHQHRIGVDLERVREGINVEDLAQRFFSENELRKLRSLPPAQQREAFYRAWTRKEAYLKARGEGLSFGLDRVEVSLAPDEPAMILSAADDPGISQRWAVQHLLPRPGYVGAATVEASNIEFKYFELEQA